MRHWLPACAWLLLAGPAAAEEVPPWVGVWAAEEAWCAGGGAEGRPIRVTPGGYAGYENRCDFTRISRLGRARWWMETECDGEGVLYRERYLYEVEDDGGTLVITFLDRGWTEIRFSRCPPE